MTFKDQVAKVKSLLSAVFEEAIPSAGTLEGADTLQDYTTDGGVIVKINKLEPGGMVYQQDGTTAVVTGFTLADGTIVAVDEYGVITSVTVPIDQAVPVAPVAAPVAAPTPAPYPAGFEERFEALEREFAEWKAAEGQKFTHQFEAAQNAQDQRFAKLQDGLNEVVKLVEVFAASPSDEPIVKPTGEEKITKSARRDLLAQNIAARKSKASA